MLPYKVTCIVSCVKLWCHFTKYILHGKLSDYKMPYDDEKTSVHKNDVFSKIYYKMFCKMIIKDYFEKKKSLIFWQVAVVRWCHTFRHMVASRGTTNYGQVSSKLHL